MDKSGLAYKKMVAIYISIVLIFAGLYSLPISLNKTVPFLDILFLSASAISVTGLSTLDIASTFSLWGKIFIILEMEIGGIGILDINQLFIYFNG